MIKNVKTHLICGFLGAGKTSAIAYLLSQCPANERWAVLVNEFGEIGLDKALLASKQTESANIEIMQVPGGCMCCAAGVPMVVALNKLLTTVKPDRLFIEPTGLGHPKQVLAALLKPEYQGVLDVQGVTTLVDARVLSQPRYREHEIFRQQIELADLILASKADLYRDQEITELKAFVSELSLDKAPQIQALYHAEFPLAWLPLAEASVSQQMSSIRLVKPQGSEKSVILKSNTLPSAPPPSSKEFFSFGWQFEQTVHFDQTQLLALFNELDALRIKGVINTQSGAIKVNQVAKESSIEAIETQPSSKVEFIFSHQASDKQNTQQYVYELLNKCCIR